MAHICLLFKRFCSSSAAVDHLYEGYRIREGDEGFRYTDQS